MPKLKKTNDSVPRKHMDRRTDGQTPFYIEKKSSLDLLEGSSHINMKHDQYNYFHKFFGKLCCFRVTEPLLHPFGSIHLLTN